MNCYPFKIVVFIGFVSGSLFATKPPKRKTISGPPPSKKPEVDYSFSESLKVEYKPDIEAIEARSVKTIAPPFPQIFTRVITETKVLKNLDGTFKIEATRAVIDNRPGWKSALPIDPPLLTVKMLKEKISEFEEKMREQERKAIEENLQDEPKVVGELITQFTTGIQPPPHKHKTDEAQLSAEDKWLLSDIDSYEEWEKQEGGK